MRRWVKPRTEVQKFEANEYVAACFKLACSAGSEINPHGPHWDSPEEGNVSHSPKGTPKTCGDPSANRVITTDGGFFESVAENNGEQGWIEGGLDYVLQMDGNSTIDPDDVIYWHTYSNDRSRKWNHWGYVEQQDPSHPNHS